MAKFFGGLFDLRSKEDKERDLEVYTNMIFPFGDEHKEKVYNILEELLPKQNQKYLRMHYILLKEAMIGEEKLSYEEATKKIAKQTLVKTTEELKVLVKALLEIDLTMDENLIYPSATQIRNKSNEQ